MAKEVTGYIKLQIKGGAANPAPPVGPALGSKGLNIMDFCKAFNAATQGQAGKVLPVVITVYSDKSYTFEVKQPPVDQVKTIAEGKMPDLNCFTLAAAMKMVAGTARSMGITVSGEFPENI